MLSGDQEGAGGALRGDIGPLLPVPERDPRHRQDLVPGRTGRLRGGPVERLGGTEHHRGRPVDQRCGAFEGGEHRHGERQAFACQSHHPEPVLAFSAAGMDQEGKAAGKRGWRSLEGGVQAVTYRRHNATRGMAAAFRLCHGVPGEETLPEYPGPGGRATARAPGDRARMGLGGCRTTSILLRVRHFGAVAQLGEHPLCSRPDPHHSVAHCGRVQGERQRNGESEDGSPFRLPPSASRARLRGNLDERVAVLEEIADDPAMAASDRIRAVDVIAKYGLGTERMREIWL